MNKKSQIKVQDPKVVVIGGGTGLSVLLRGLKEYTSDITAIVTVADDGGNSGHLREELGILPPGDIRACLLALANTEPAMEKLFNYRFNSGILNGHNIGNLLIAAMNDIYGNFEQAIKEMSNVLAVTGKVLPMTLSDVKLCAVLQNGKKVKGESLIPKAVIKERSPIKKIYMEPEVSYPLKETVEAISKADLIVLGPGSLYTSVIPNLLINNIVDKIESSSAKKVYICNIMTQLGETDNYCVSDHVKAILNHSKLGFIDYVIVNNGEIPKTILSSYSKDGSDPVKMDESDRFFLKEQSVDILEDNLIDIDKDGYLRHNNIILNKLLMKIYEEKC